MKRSRNALWCAVIAAVLLVGAVAPAVADKQTETYSCTKTRPVERCVTVPKSYTCTKQRLVERCVRVPEKYACTQQRLVERCVTRSVPYTCTKTKKVWECELVPDPGGGETEICGYVTKEYETTCYRDETDCWDEWETYQTTCTRYRDDCWDEWETYTTTCTRNREDCWMDTETYQTTCTRNKSHTHSIYCTMPAGASEGGYTSGTMTGVSDYTSTHHDPQYQCSEKKAQATKWLNANPVCSVDGKRMSTSDCDKLKCADSASSWPATCGRCLGTCELIPTKCANSCSKAPVLPSIGDRSDPVGASIDWTMPEATTRGPAGTKITYSLKGSLPSGLTFKAADRTVSGRISGSPQRYSDLAYTARDKGGATTQQFDWTVTETLGGCYRYVGTAKEARYYLVKNGVTEAECDLLWSPTKGPPAQPCWSGSAGAAYPKRTYCPTDSLLGKSRSCWDGKQGWSVQECEDRLAPCIFDDPNPDKSGKKITLKGVYTESKCEDAKADWIATNRPECRYEDEVLAAAGLLTPEECDAEKLAKEGKMSCELPIGLHFALTVLTGDDDLPTNFVMTPDDCAEINADYLLVKLQSRSEKDAFYQEVARFLGLI